MRKLRVYLRLSWTRRVLLLEATALLAMAAVSIAFLPFPWVARHLGTTMGEHAGWRCARDATVTKAIGWAVHVAARNLPWRSTCFAQAATAKIMLRRRGVRSTLFLGVASQGAGMLAHAWLRSGQVTVTGSEASRDFVTVCWIA
jgi:hypothetical protein